MFFRGFSEGTELEEIPATAVDSDSDDSTADMLSSVGTPPIDELRTVPYLAKRTSLVEKPETKEAKKKGTKEAPLLKEVKEFHTYTCVFEVKTANSLTAAPEAFIQDVDSNERGKKKGGQMRSFRQRNTTNECRVFFKEGSGSSSSSSGPNNQLVVQKRIKATIPSQVKGAFVEQYDATFHKYFGKYEKYERFTGTEDDLKAMKLLYSYDAEARSE